jgi:amino-acid N-acetyltransferase
MHLSTVPRIDAPAAIGPGLRLRKPTVQDVPEILRLIEPDLKAGRLLPRSGRQVVEHLRDYTLALRDGNVVGVASITLVDVDLAEVGVLTSSQDEISALLLDTVLLEAAAMGVGRAFVLTDDPSPFEALGFRRTTLAALPEKRDRQCLRCSRLPFCRQVALERNLEPQQLRATA